MCPGKRPRGAAQGFTLIELLVVIAIIALLMSILLPSLQMAREQARQVVCSADLAGISKAMVVYKHDNEGYLPGSGIPAFNADAGNGVWSEASWGIKKGDLWFYTLADRCGVDPKSYICPSDPFRGQFDFEAVNPTTGKRRTNTVVPSCGYGLSYVLRNDNTDPGVPVWNLDKTPPRSPEQTILMAEVGADDTLRQEQLEMSADGPDVGQPWRDGGRFLWDDGLRGWYTGKTWLTARHRGRINMVTMGLRAVLVPTTPQIKDQAKMNAVRSRYFGNAAKPLKDCWGHNVALKTFVCPFCQGDPNTGTGASPHYDFAGSDLWWWYGKWPR